MLADKHVRVMGLPWDRSVHLDTQPTLAALAQGVCTKLPLISMALTCILGGLNSSQLW